jgi:restriction system protein
MKIKENSLFAILLRSQWWVSVLIALAVIGVLRYLMPTMYAVAAALPFIGIAAYVAWKQLREPGGKRIARTLERLRAMPWDEFAGEMAKAYGREGYEVQRLGTGQADLELARAGRKTLVACKRWKATRTGVEPLRELEAARRKREANECIYVAAGEITAQARAFAAESKIRLMEGAELAKKLGA